jgi:hypothetical protein
LERSRRQSPDRAARDDVLVGDLREQVLAVFPAGGCFPIRWSLKVNSSSRAESADCDKLVAHFRKYFFSRDEISDWLKVV